MPRVPRQELDDALTEDEDLQTELAFGTLDPAQVRKLKHLRDAQTEQIMRDIAACREEIELDAYSAEGYGHEHELDDEPPGSFIDDFYDE